jgi:hypothetical protein
LFGLIPAGAAIGIAAQLQRGEAAVESRPRSDFEPRPIDLPAQTIARARDLFGALRSGTIDRSQFDPQMNAFLTDETLARGAGLMRDFGEPQTFTPVQLRITAEGSAAYFRLAFPSETLTWVVRTSTAATINGFSLRRSERDKIFNVFVRQIEGY